MPRYLGDVTEEPMFELTRDALKERRYHTKILVADVLRAVEPRYDDLDAFHRNIVDWVVGTSARYLGYDKINTTIPGVTQRSYVYVYRGPANPEPGQRVHYDRRPRVVRYDDPTADPWFMTVRDTLEVNKHLDQTPVRAVLLSICARFYQSDGRERAMVSQRVNAICRHLGYHRVRSSTPATGKAWFYRKSDPRVPRFRRSGDYSDLWDPISGRPLV